MKKLKLTGEKIYIREWKIEDAKMLSTLGENAKLENAEIRILDWALKFTQTKLGTLPFFDLSDQLLGIISLQPKLIKNKAIFELRVVTAGETLADEFTLEAKHLMSQYARETLGITEVVG